MVKIMENPIKMDDLGIPLFLETTRYVRISPYNPMTWGMGMFRPAMSLDSQGHFESNPKANF